MGKRRAGHTLLEVLIAAGLLGLLATMIAIVVVQVGAHTDKGTRRVEVQQFALVAAQRICSDLQDTAPGAMSLVRDSDQLILALHPLDTITETGRQAWAPRLRVLRWSSQDQRLERWQWPATGPQLDPGRPTVLDEAGVRDLVDDPRYGSSVVASSLVSLEIYGGDALPSPFPTYSSSFPQPLNVKVVARSRPSGTGKQAAECPLLRRLYQANSVR